MLDLGTWSVLELANLRRMNDGAFQEQLALERNRYLKRLKDLSSFRETEQKTFQIAPSLSTETRETVEMLPNLIHNYRSAENQPVNCKVVVTVI